MQKQKCGRKTEVFSRVVGYFRPVSQWNAGKASEFYARKAFKVDKVEKQKNGNQKN
jgi:ribonucleoside-triphosphate reductase